MPEAELTPPPSGTCRGIIGMGVDCTGRTLATGFSSLFSAGCLREEDKRTQSSAEEPCFLYTQPAEPLPTSPSRSPAAAAAAAEGGTYGAWPIHRRTRGRTEQSRARGGEGYSLSGSKKSQVSMEQPLYGDGRRHPLPWNWGRLPTLGFGPCREVREGQRCAREEKFLGTQCVLS